ncbi:hypothetical protein [Burkholderia glumae]|uniref:hypothetical protein n=1 Tax=Burkholderia glumae TaxID=337 RepID=UPI003B968D32
MELLSFLGCTAAEAALVAGRRQGPCGRASRLRRRRRAEFAGWDILLRLHARFDRKAMPSAASPPLAALCEGEIRELLDKAAREVARRGPGGAGPASG